MPPYVIHIVGIPIVILGALVLVVPLAILIGQRLRSGPIAVASGGALLGLAAFWLLIRQTYIPSDAYGPYVEYSEFALVGTSLLLIVGWALALADAAQARRWGWIALLCFATYISMAAMFFSVVATPYATCGANPWLPECLGVNPVEEVLTITSGFFGPTISLVYALYLRAPQSRALPDGLSVSPLDAPQAEPL